VALPIYGRIAGHYHLNPFLHPPSAVAHDALFQLVDPQWRGLVSPYGPLFIDVAAGIDGPLSSPQDLALAYKCLAAVSSLAMMFLVRDMARRLWPTREAYAVGLIALNPAILVTVVGSGQNDALLAFLLSLAVWVHVRTAASTSRFG
jgi:alpha-1,6-mannosyltransferase